jgi:hypothetical protein
MIAAMTSTRACVSSLFLLAAACGGGGGSTDIESTLRFADRTDVEIARLINAAAGSDMFLAAARVDDFGDTFDGDPCPTIAVAGSTVTVTGGCTRRDGTEVRGAAVITNPFAWDQVEDYDFGDDTTYEFQQLVLADDDFEQTFDGVMARADSMTVWDADVTVTQGGLTLRSDLYYKCSNPSAPRCALSGSGLELIGVGGARVSGQVVVDPDTNRQTADFTLTGADTLTVHTDGVCVEWQIEGTDRQMVCR